MIRHARPVWAEIDLAAISHNVSTLATFTNTSVMAVVKADAYGHGSVPAARAALSGGAERLAVALVEEAAVLRDAGIEAPILLLSEPEATAAAEVVDLRITPTVYTEHWADALATAARRQQATVAVHLKVDTGMHRVGARPGDVVDLARRIEAAGGLALEGIWTHLAVADEVDHPATGRQVELFDQTLKSLADAGIHPSLVHAANSAGALGVPEARRDFVRAGISTYGVLPAPGYRPDPGLRPAMSLHARLSFVKRVAAGERISYGLTEGSELAVESTIATVPIGYADGYTRRLSNCGEALVRGRRVRVVGTVTMDQTMLDCGELPVEAGDEVVLMGRQGDDEITAAELAGHTGTIAYEVLCAIGKRVPRVYRS